MKKVLIFVLLFISTTSYSEDFRGLWKGTGHSADSASIEISFSVTIHKDSIIRAFLYKPTSFMLADSNFHGKDLHLQSLDWLIKSQNNILLKKKQKGEEVTFYEKIIFDGALTANNNHMKGEFTYLGKVYQADLYRGNGPAFRPQEPKKPYPYISEEVKFINKKDSVLLAGTLTLPAKEGKFPAVILRGGSLPFNRDGGNSHKPFLLLADFLTRHGIAVLRYDDRGIEKSQGDFWKSTPLDFAGDLNAGFEFLSSREDIKSDQIGLIGSSEGGMVASMAACQNRDFKFVVMLAGPGICLKDVFEFQSELYYKNGEMSKELLDFWKNIHNEIYKLADQGMNSRAIFKSLIHYENEFISMAVNSNPQNIESATIKRVEFAVTLGQKSSAHSLFNLKVNPSDYIEKLTCPVLSLNGSNDRLVDAKINQQAIKQALEKAGNKDYKIVKLEGVNHFFQECKTGSIQEALTLEQTFSPKALELISEWIEDHVE